MQQHMDIAILVPGPNMHYFTGLHLKQSERLTFAVITANNDLYFILPQVELNKVDLSNGGVILSYSDEEGPTLAIQRLKKEMGTLQTIGVEFDTMRVHEQKSIEMLTYENLSDIGESIRELRMKKICKN